MKHLHTATGTARIPLRCTKHRSITSRTRVALLALACVGSLGGNLGLAQETSTNASCDLRIASGPQGKVYEMVVRDIQAVCGATVSVCSVPSSGGLQNLTMLSANEAELGIAQVDTLRDMSDGDENIRNLQAVLPLHINLLHILASNDGTLVGARSLGGVAIPGTGNVLVIRKFTELKGMTVAAVGTAQLMGRTLERQLGYGMKLVVADNDEQALGLLKSGQVQAIFTLGGWPLPSIARLKPGSGVHLVDFDLEPRNPYVGIKRNYQNLEAYNLNFLGSPNLLLARNFKAGGTLAAKVSGLQACVRRHLDDLQEGRYLSIWKEIRDPSATYGVAPTPSSTKVVRK